MRSAFLRILPLSPALWMLVFPQTTVADNETPESRAFLFYSATPEPKGNEYEVIFKERAMAESHSFKSYLYGANPKAATMASQAKSSHWMEASQASSGHCAEASQKFTASAAVPVWSFASLLPEPTIFLVISSIACHALLLQVLAASQAFWMRRVTRKGVFHSVRPMAARLSSTVPRYLLAAKRKDGTEFPIELTLASWQMADGDVAFTGMLRDITLKQEAERKLLQSTEHLRKSEEDLRLAKEAALHG